MDAWIEANDYVAALEWLSGLDQEDPDVRLQLEKTWLNNGLHNMNTFDAGQMRTRMNDALRSFANVLELNPQNQIAREQIVSILAVYSTMPGRGPEPDVAERLAGLGFQP